MVLSFIFLFGCWCLIVVVSMFGVLTPIYIIFVWQNNKGYARV